MSLEVKVALTATGIFFLTALATGIWKYRWMMVPPAHQAPAYVDIAYRAALLYSFAGILLARFVELSAFPRGVNLAAVCAPLVFFAVAIATYIRLGLANQTDNQFRVRSFETTWGMVLLIVAEVGGFVVLFAGFVVRVWIRPG